MNSSPQIKEGKSLSLPGYLVTRNLPINLLGSRPKLPVLGFFESFESNSTEYLDMKTFLYEGEEVLISNSYKFIKDKSPFNRSNYLGDCLVYLLAESFTNPFVKKDNLKDLNGTQVFTRYLHLVLKWLQLAKVSVMNEDLGGILNKRRDFCHFCGRRIKYLDPAHSDENKDFFGFYKGHFCKKSHYTKFSRIDENKTNLSIVGHIISYTRTLKTRLDSGSTFKDVEKDCIELVEKICNALVGFHIDLSCQGIKELPERITNTKFSKVLEHLKGLPLEKWVEAGLIIYNPASEVLTNKKVPNGVVRSVDELASKPAYVFLVDTAELRQYCEYKGYSLGLDPSYDDDQGLGMEALITLQIMINYFQFVPFCEFFEKLTKC